MTGNISYLSEYEPYNGGYVSFGQGGGKITGKGKIKTGKLKFENVYFVKELKYNLFSVSQICNNKNSVLFTDSECIVLGKDFKLKKDTNVLLRTPRQHNMYSIDLNNIVPHKNLTCLVAKASINESMLWHRRLGHLNFKTMNKLVRNNLVRGLSSKCFDNDHTFVACLKGKQHKSSCKTKLVNYVSKPLHTLHMDLFGPTSVSSLNHKWYCLVVTDDFSRVLVYKYQNKTPYELFNTRTPAIGFLRRFRCYVMILNTLDHLGKFDAKGDEGITLGGAQQMKSPIIGAQDKGKQKVVESDVPKKRKIQEQIDAQVAREREEEFARENKKSNEVIAKHLQEYEQAAAELTVGEKIELINELEIKEKFIPVWKQLEDFVPMSLTEEGKRVKRKGLKLDKGSSKRMKTSKDVSVEKLKEMIQLVRLEEVYVEALQVKHPIIDWEIYSEEKREYWKIIRLGGDIHAGTKGLSTKEGTCHFQDEELIEASSLDEHLILET
nr:putative ribonuclease H-like domain-containing protein [Tanacetum cinerariifolium]